MAGRATVSGTWSSCWNVAPTTIPSPMPYRSGRAPATTRPVELMDVKPGSIASASFLMSQTRSADSSRFVATFFN